jgi:hypothetical protein
MKHTVLHTVIRVEHCLLNNMWDNANKTLSLIRTNVPDREPSDVPALQNSDTTIKERQIGNARRHETLQANENMDRDN